MAKTKATTRNCKVCGQDKLLGVENFRPHNNPNGVVYERRCKACDRENARQRMDARRQTEEGVEACRKAVAKWKQRNPEMVKKQHQR